MPNLPTNLIDAETAIRAALVEAFSEIPGIGTVQDRDREANTEEQYRKIIPYIDPITELKTFRGVFIKFLGYITEMKEVSCRKPARLRYSITFRQQLEDLRKDGTNSDQDFTRNRLAVFNKINNDRNMGYDDLYLLGPTVMKDAEVKKLDGKNQAHEAVDLIECVIGDC